jgi:hypothetical protein
MDTCVARRACFRSHVTLVGLPFEWRRESKREQKP